MARLRVECQGRTQDMPVVGNVVTLGRGEENTIILDDKQASRLHCQIEKFDAGWKVVDLESRNGTKVNGGFVNQHLLRNGDRIEVGEVVVTYLSSAQEDTDPALQPVPEAVRKAARPTPASMPSPVRSTGTVPRAIPRSSSGTGVGTTVALLVVLAIGGVIAVGLGGNDNGDAKRAKLAYEEGLKFEKEGKYQQALNSFRSIDPQQGEYNKVQEKIAVLESALRGMKNQEKASAEAQRLKEVKDFAAANQEKPDEVAKRVELFAREFPASLAVQGLRALVASLRTGGGGVEPGNKGGNGNERGYASIETVATQLKASKKFGEALKVLNQFLKEYPTSKDAGRAEQLAKDVLGEAEVFVQEQEAAAKQAMKDRKYAVAREAWQAVIACFGDERTSLFEMTLRAKNELKRIDELEGLEKK